MVPSVRPLLDALDASGFHFGPGILAEALRLAPCGRVASGNSRQIKQRAGSLPLDPLPAHDSVTPCLPRSPSRNFTPKPASMSALPTRPECPRRSRIADD
ncbi:MAG: DUF3368 domain-containing protein [Opitutaceae bacterium]|nr:DUF3368 domain-containing protein [Opitutaceae bacterium]